MLWSDLIMQQLVEVRIDEHGLGMSYQHQFCSCSNPSLKLVQKARCAQAEDLFLERLNHAKDE